MSDELREFQAAVYAKRMAEWLHDPKVGTEFPTEEALKTYLHDHPGADPHNHSVKKDDGKSDGAGSDTDDGDIKSTDKMKEVATSAAKELKYYKAEKALEPVMKTLHSIAQGSVKKDDVAKALSHLEKAIDGDVLESTGVTHLDGLRKRSLQELHKRLKEFQ